MVCFDRVSLSETHVYAEQTPLWKSAHYLGKLTSSSSSSLVFGRVRRPIEVLVLQDTRYALREHLWLDMIGEDS